MKKISLTGKWKIESRYGEVYGPNNTGKVNLWELELINSEGEFSGTGYDISEVSQNSENTKIEGFIEKDLITFVRQYLHSHEITDDGTTFQIPNEP
ncbi:hypothetical protein BH09BAC5_BH09BAC5_25070 [soil metagenome]